MSRVGETSRVQMAQSHDSMGASHGEKEQQGVSISLSYRLVHWKKSLRFELDMVKKQ